MTDVYLSDCARPYSSSGDPSFFIFYSSLHSLLTLGYNMMIDNRMADIV